MTDFTVLMSVTIILTGFGLTMVLSASNVEAYRQLGSSYARFLPQVLYAVVGLVVMLAIVRLPTPWLRRCAGWLLLVSFVLLAAVLVPGIGTEQMGAQSWIRLGSLSFQPSEFTKVALVVWSAHVVALHISTRRGVDGAFRLVSAVSWAILLLVVLQKDLGTAITLGVIFLAVIWCGTFGTRLFTSITIGLGLAFAVLAVTAGYRSDRLRAFLNPHLDPQGLNYQSTQARYALADGGIFGVGLGQSDAKWSYLPQAYNDFIFAVIGEELGFVGAAATLGFFVVIAWFGFRVASASTDPFLKVVAAVSTLWVVTQAAINIYYVVGLLPVTGLQLPLISAGGTSMVTTLAMFGLLLHAALREPGALAALEASHNRRWLHLFVGRPHSPPVGARAASSTPSRRGTTRRGSRVHTARREPRVRVSGERHITR